MKALGTLAMVLITSTTAAAAPPQPSDAVKRERAQQVYNDAHVAERDGRWREALAAYAEVATIAPDDTIVVQALSARALLLEHVGELAEARDVFLAVHERTRTAPTPDRLGLVALQNAAVLTKTLGDPARASELFVMCADRYPADPYAPRALLDAARLLEQLGQLTRASELSVRSARAAADDGAKLLAWALASRFASKANAPRARVLGYTAHVERIAKEVGDDDRVPVERGYALGVARLVIAGYAEANFERRPTEANYRAARGALEAAAEVTDKIYREARLRLAELILAYARANEAQAAALRAEARELLVGLSRVVVFDDAGARGARLLSELDGTMTGPHTMVTANPTTTTSFITTVRRGARVIDFERPL